MSELFEKSIRTLELPAVLELLAAQAVSDEAKDRARKLCPVTDYDEVNTLQDQTDAARAMLGLQGSPNFAGLKDIASELARADRGGILSTRELLTVAGVLRCARRVREYVEREQIDLKDYIVVTGYGYDYGEYEQINEQVAAMLAEMGVAWEKPCDYHIGVTIGVHTGPHPIGMAIMRRA